MHRIIIGEGLTNEVLSPQHQYQTAPDNVGQREIGHLLGKGKSFGDGPLPTFLRSAVAARAAGEPVDLLFLRPIPGEPEGEKDAAGPGPLDFVDPIAEVAGEALVVGSDPEVIPWRNLIESIEQLTGTDPASPEFDGRFLVVGCHTDQRVLAIASFLKEVLGCPEVAVSSHLVGSATREAHLATLRHYLPAIGVKVLLDLEETAGFIDIPAEELERFAARPCEIEPADAVENMDDHQRRIVELLCLHWTKAHLRPLAGGYSGSLLFLADGWKGDAKTEPMVLKIDATQQMRRELDGYYQVKDFFGKHVPTFGYPVARDDSLGVGMDLAAMEGSPETLQDTFEQAEDDDSVAHFMLRLDKALALLSEKLYRNTSEVTWVAPYRAFGLHAEVQLDYFNRNTGLVSQYLEDEGASEADVNAEQLAKVIRLVTANEDGVDSELCLVHGDLNYANIICDEGNNVWFIDWTHCGIMPIELDFAKLENDVKFVMTKTFDVEDLPRLKAFEEYVLSHRVPADVDGLPDSLKFAKWDLRFRKILEAVRRIRTALFALKEGDDWLVYRTALLRYAMHTLSFDKRRQRGECDLPQLVHALYSVQTLVFDLVADDFHLRIRAERPSSYPPRQRISIDEGPWVLDCPDYDPPYHVDEIVLANDSSKVADGWADPEDVKSIADELASREAKQRDELGRPLNPRGRTGIAGRGLLGAWGANLSVAAVVVRRNRSDELEILLGQSEDDTELEMAKGFMHPGETSEACLQRVIEVETSWAPEKVPDEVIFEGFTYDQRQTDHAWVESRVFLLDAGKLGAPESFSPGGDFDDVKWWPLTAETVNRVPAGTAGFIRDAVTALKDSNRIDAGAAETLLAKTG
ncbi:MAG: NUDIX domain-containing protein [Acidobacteria bacterium]|nr:MAG: NUDIX domain-containing protein [Acidobacteriota bacterium]